MANLKGFNVEAAVRWSGLKTAVGWGIGTCLMILMIVAWLSDLGTQGLGEIDFGFCFGALAVGIFTFVCGWMTFSGIKLMNNPRSHGIYAKLAAMGQVETMVADVEKQVRDCGQQLGSFVFTPNYLLDHGNLVLMEYTDLMWIYKKQTRHSVNFIPTGSTYEVIIHTRDGKERNMSASCKVVEQVLRTLAQGCPWIVAGYSEQLRNLWTRSTGDFIAEVDARRMAYEAESAQ